MITRWNSIVLGILAASLAGLVVAEPVGIATSPGVRIFPSIGLAVEHDDNYFKTPAAEESATSLVVTPGLLVQLRSGTAQVDLGIDAEAGFPDTESEDRYLDHDIFAQGQWDPTSRHHFTGEVRRIDDHDPFGLRRTEGTALANRSLDEFHENILAGSYRFGAPSARINVQIGAQTRSKEYDTNRAQTQFLDFDKDTYTGTVFFNPSPRTSLFVEYEASEIEYDEVRAGVAARDGDEDIISVGARWSATAKTTGEVKVGQIDREFDDPAREDFDGTNWEASIIWTPRSRDTVRLTTSRDAVESFLDAADFIDREFTELSWRHFWGPRVSTLLRAGTGEDDFEGFVRKDDRDILGAELAYELRRWVTLFGEYQYIDRDSSINARDFDANIFRVGVRFAP